MSDDAHMPLAWRRLEHHQGTWGVLWIQVHRRGALWRVTLEEDGGLPQGIFHGTGPARTVCGVANQALEQCLEGGWRIITGSAHGTFGADEVLPAPAWGGPVRSLSDALFA